jgi:hypothetical protein
VGELLYSLVKIPAQPLFLPANGQALQKSDVGTSSRVIMRLFRVAKSGNAPKLEVLLKGVACKCAGLDDVPRVQIMGSTFGVDYTKYRAELGAALLKKDWIKPFFTLLFLENVRRWLCNYDMTDNINVNLSHL